MRRDKRRSARVKGRTGRRAGGGSRGRFEDLEEQEPARGRKASRGSRGRDRGRSRGRDEGGRRGLDFSAIDGDDDRRDRDEFEDRERAPVRRGPRREPGRRRKTLMDLCTPLFGYAAVLPRQEGEHQPDFRQFRDQVEAALHRLESEAADNGIEPEDARHASYALCFFLDAQVAESIWQGKMDWANQPLGIMRHQDPEGGVNFFRRLESFGERQRDVKEVYLVCLALGFRGKLAELEPTRQAAELAELKKRLSESIRPEPLDKLEMLFPDAYREAEPIEDEVPPPPRWWTFASIGAVVLAVVVWVLLFVWAGSSPKSATQVVRQQLDRRPPARSTESSVVDAGTASAEGAER